MTYQIGLAVPNATCDSVIAALNSRALAFGYHFEPGVQSFWAEIREGIARVAESHSWCVGRLSALGSEVAPLCSELQAFIRGEGEPPFFSFLGGLDSVVPAEGLALFFADEWELETQPRVASGRPSDLICYLRAFKDWTGYVEVRPNHLRQMDHDVPLIFLLETGRT